MGKARARTAYTKYNIFPHFDRSVEKHLSLDSVCITTHAAASPVASGSLAGNGDFYKSTILYYIRAYLRRALE